jgi:VanZ family protein
MVWSKGLYSLSVFIFLIGCIYYLIERCFFGELFFTCESSSPIWTSFPSFVHVFSFSILHTLLFKASRNFTVTLWLVINIIFEVGQLWSGNGEVLHNSLQIFFAKGRFDLLDLFWALVGAVCAFLLLGKLKHENPTSIT